jgi:hypothetical protein
VVDGGAEAETEGSSGGGDAERDLASERQRVIHEKSVVEVKE